jgi:hypothetical protein
MGENLLAQGGWRAGSLGSLRCYVTVMVAFIDEWMVQVMW